MHVHDILANAVDKKARVTVNTAQQYSSLGFTIVELLVVIVIIGILATIVIVSYTGISSKAVFASVQSDLTNASKQLKLYQVYNMNFPTSIDCSASPAANSICLKTSPNNIFTYQVNNNSSPQTFTLYVTNGAKNYRITSHSDILQTSKICPINFIVVPGSITYGTSDFCVMKYEASQVGTSNVPISQAGSVPWVMISQTTSIANSSNVDGCTGCHLITEAEWLTIVQNVIGVASNWSTGIVGSGYIYSGHNDSLPNNSLAADINDSNGYAGTDNTSDNQRRTLTLSNGEVIWDVAGDVWEWTSGVVTGGQLGVIGAGALRREYPDVTTPGTMSPNPMPVTTGVAGAASWNSSNGIGQVYSNADNNGTYALHRGGSWTGANYAGVFALRTSYWASDYSGFIGFRVAK